MTEMTETSFIEFFQRGGLYMWAIAAIGVFAVFVFLERIFALYGKASVNKTKFVNNVERSILSGDLNSAINHCNGRKSPLNNIVKAGLISVMNRGTDDEVQTSMDVAALREIPYVEKRTPWLALFGNVATLVGLLSTVAGMITAFQSVSSADPSQKAVMLAQGVATAMNGTFFGLIIAIPSLLASAWLAARTQEILDDVHEISVATLNLILQNRDKFPARQ